MLGERLSIWELIDAHSAAEAGRPSRYSLQGPWNFGDPVHETLTRKSLEAAGLVDFSWEPSDFRVWEYMRGVIWNDDPEALLFDENARRTDDFSSGIAFAAAFKSAEKRARGTFFGPDARLLARSHFGDLQFLHGMASRDGEAPQQTLESILRWCAFTSDVAARRVDGATRLSSLAHVATLFTSNKELTVAELFGVTKLGDVHRRALGSLLHLVQDSHAGGHVERELRPDGSAGAILCFYSYAGQDHGKHAADDGWRADGSEEERIRSVKGAKDAIGRGAQLARLVADGAEWSALEAFLRSEVFALSQQARPSGPGAAYAEGARG